MKREGKILIFLCLIIILCLIFAPFQIFKNTSRVTQSVGVNIPIIILPTLTIISPQNETYLNNLSIPLNYSVENEVWVKYSLDSGDNITLTSSIYFNASEGNHTLYLYANNSDGITARSVNFSVNSTLFSIIQEEYNENSTNFTILSYQGIQNLSNILLENNNFGKIVFNENINLTDDGDTTDNEINLDENINISSNRIELNSTGLPNFNKSATLYLYGLAFTNPRVLKDGSLCSAAICTRESYLGGILKFNVTGFSVYSAEETPTETAAPGGGGGGGGVAAKRVGEKTSFSVDKEIIKILIKKGDIFKTSIKIKNTENTIQDFTLDEIALTDFIIFPESRFSLKPQEEKEVILIFSSAEDTKEDTYTGKLKISSSKSQKEIPIILGIRSKISLFDITLNIPAAYKDLKPGDNILFQISLFNLGEIGKVDVAIEYLIKDFYGNVITRSEGVIAVETQASFSRSFELPSNIADGQYVAIANVKYGPSVATTSDVFYVNKKKIFGLEQIYLIGIVLALIIILISTILIVLHIINKKMKEMSKINYKELEKIKKKVQRGHLKPSEAVKINEKLKSKGSLLREAYEKGYINKKSYKKGREKIKKLYQSLKKKYS